MFVANFSIKSAVQKALVFLRRTVDYAEMHPYLAMERKALEETVEFITRQMPDAMAFDTPKDLLRYALARVPADGIVAEFGVNGGGTMRFIASRLPDRRIDGFDSFQGLPEDWSGSNMAAGYFDRAGRLPRLPASVTLHPGWFAQSLPSFVAEYSGPLAFLHVDCDIYSSTKTIFDHLGDRLQPGSIIVFDEYFNYPNWQHHEHRAFREFIEAGSLRFRYLAYAFRQVAVAIE